MQTASNSRAINRRALGLAAVALGIAISGCSRVEIKPAPLYPFGGKATADDGADKNGLPQDTAPLVNELDQREARDNATLASVKPGASDVQLRARAISGYQADRPSRATARYQRALSVKVRGALFGDDDVDVRVEVRLRVYVDLRSGRGSLRIAASLSQGLNDPPLTQRTQNYDFKEGASTVNKIDIAVNNAASAIALSNGGEVDLPFTTTLRLKPGEYRLTAEAYVEATADTRADIRPEVKIVVQRVGT